jgi:RNA polymerase sigma-70 factor, ECF subfamily
MGRRATGGPLSFGGETIWRAATYLNGMADDEPLEGVLARVALGDRRAFEALYRRTSAKLFGVCVRILRERGDAEEALQETYVRVWKNAGRYTQAKASPITWLVTIARNQAIDRLRTRKVTAVDLDDALEIPDTLPTPEARTVQLSERARLENCLGTLDTPSRDIVRRAFFGEITYERLAEMDGLPLGTVKSRIRRSLVKLRDCLSQ